MHAVLPDYIVIDAAYNVIVFPIKPVFSLAPMKEQAANGERTKLVLQEIQCRTLPWRPAVRRNFRVQVLLCATLSCLRGGCHDAARWAAEAVWPTPKSVNQNHE
jgi:hypothetical protein